MANVTVSPGKRGPVEVLVQLEDTDEKPLAAEALSVTLSNHETGVAPLTAEAERVSGDGWRVRMAAEASGKWSLSLEHRRRQERPRRYGGADPDQMIQSPSRTKWTISLDSKPGVTRQASAGQISITKWRCEAAHTQCVSLRTNQTVANTLGINLNGDFCMTRLMISAIASVALLAAATSMLHIALAPDQWWCENGRYADDPRTQSAAGAEGSRSGILRTGHWSIRGRPSTNRRPLAA